jgi:phage-related minor tail protein
MSKNALYTVVQTKDATDALKTKEREDIQKLDKERIAKFESDIKDAKQKGEAAVQLKEDDITKLKGELAAKDATLKAKDDEIAKLKAELAAKSASPTSTPGDDMTKQIADLKAELAKAASASVSPIQPKIETILNAFKTADTQEYDKYIIHKLEGGFHIKLKTKP